MNNIINTIKREKREERKAIHLSLVELCSPTNYIQGRTVPLSMHDIFIQHVQKEDILLSPYTPITIPKLDIKVVPIKGVGIYGFFKSILP